MKSLDVVALCNALVDILVEAQEDDLKTLGLNKGVMHLVDSDRQREVLDHFADQLQTIELGGSSMNAVRTLAALGCRTAFAGAIGNDEFGLRIKTRMQQLGIKAHLQDQKDATGTCAILITPDGERTMNTNLGASRLYTKELVPKDDIANARILHFCGYQWDTDNQKDAIRLAIATAEKNDTMISFDLADPFVVKRYAPEFDKLIHESADIVFMNREEAKLLYGKSPEDTARAVGQANAIAVVKLSADGALICKGKEEIRVPAVPTTVVDTTAAGDMFAAGFLYGMSKGKSLQLCGHMAALLASDVISRIGATVSGSALAQVGEL